MPPMPPPCGVRPAANDDFDAFAQITNHYIQHTPIHFSYDPVTPAAFRELWESSRDRFPWLTGTDGSGRIIAYAKAGTWRDRTAYSWTVEAGIYVHHEFHGRGVGRTLYAALIDDLRSRGFHSVVGGITLPNDASVRLHESLGFVKVAHFRHAGRKFDQWHDVGFWQLMLEA